MSLKTRNVEEWKLYLNNHFEQLQRGNGQELDPYINNIHEEFDFDDTRATIRCFSVALDGNGLPVTKQLAEYLCDFIVDYAIPRSRIQEAMAKDKQRNSSAEMTKLAIQARKLFNHLKFTGEGGEVLLYVLIQSILHIPQLLCKMPLKTSTAIHYQGIDGIHGKFDNQTAKLALYWAESKMYEDVNAAIKDCLDSLSPFLVDRTSPKIGRELQLIRDFIDLGNMEFQEGILEFLDPGKVEYRHVEFRGACLIAFDYSNYPKLPGEKEEYEILQSINNAVQTWNRKLVKEVKNRTPLDRYILEVFLLPLDSVQTFRDAFLRAL